MRSAALAMFLCASALCHAQAADPGKPRQAPPAADPAEFDGTYEAYVPAAVGKSSRQVKAVLKCAAGACDLALGDTAEHYDRLNAIRADHYSQARFALNYARERRANVKAERPWLGTLLDSNAEIEACIDLSSVKPSYAEHPGLTVLCKVSPNPWRQPVVILMGTILAECGATLCRYSLLPMFRR